VWVKAGPGPKCAAAGLPDLSAAAAAAAVGAPLPTPYLERARWARGCAAALLLLLLLLLPVLLLLLLSHGFHCGPCH
jgi:hypothetical protein